jgi:transcriptional regulator with XRE-family HTH domain
MPRQPKDPENSLTRLRAALSSEHSKMTRKLFAKRYGFSLDSITAIERGTYRLTREMAQRIEAATGVSVGSLILNSTPLRAWNGSVFSSETRPPSGQVSEQDRKKARFLLETGFDASARSNKKRDRSAEFLIMFEEWLGRAMAELDCEEVFWDRFFFSWTEFAPDQALIARFNPNVFALQRTGKQDHKKTDQYIQRLRSREERLEEAKLETLCSMLSPKNAEFLRKYLRYLRRPIPRWPDADEKRGMELHGEAYQRLAKAKGLSAEDMAVEDALLAEALNRLSRMPEVNTDSKRSPKNNASN